jgi:hypothetical protein
MLKTGRRSKACPESHTRHVLQPAGLLLDHPAPIGNTVNGQYYYVLLQEKEWRVLRRNRELGWDGVILRQDNATPHRHSDAQYLVQRRRRDVLAHPPYSSDRTQCD